MVTVQQAVFTSARTEKLDGYQLAGRSPGICGEDARELAAWGPSHDSLAATGSNAASFNFHPLPSGAHCISRTFASGSEYSGRGAPRIYTQCLIASVDALARFAFNPFSLYKAAAAGGGLQAYDQVPAELPLLELSGRAAGVDQMLLARLSVNPGPQWMGAIIHAATESVCLALVGGPPAEELIAGIFSCLPPECRTEFSFTTGLRFSLRRPFRIVGLSGTPAEMALIERRYNLSLLDLSAPVPHEWTPVDGWARLIQGALAAGRTSFLATQLSKRRFQLRVDDLPALGVQLLEDLDATALRGEPAEHAASATPNATRPTSAHQPHAEPPRFAAARQAAAAAAGATVKPAGPSKQLDPQSPEVLEKLERLDDTVWEAVGGSTLALESLRKLWPGLRTELGEDLIAESREQYLRYALSIWEEYMGAGGVRNPTRAVQALDVLCILFDRV